MVGIKKKDFELTRGREEDADPIIEEMRSITGVELAILFREQPHGYRVSMRSRGRVNAGRLAESFGGGHFDSAGALVPKSWRSLKSVLEAASAALPGGGGR